MNYAEIKNCDIANGTGVRVSLFVSGCRNHCKGCFNEEAQAFNYGLPFTRRVQYQILEMLEPDYIEGLSVLGGDPLEKENIDTVKKLLKSVKEHCNKDIWVYTGYLYEDFADNEILGYIDVLVDGRFVEEKKDISLKFKGSSNQRIIDVKESRNKGRIVLYEME